MSVQKPSLWKVLSDTSTIISSNSLHFAVLSLLFIFPITLLNIIHTLLLPPSPSPPSLFSQPHYRRLLSAGDSKIPSFDKSLILYSLIIQIFTICSVSSVTTSIYDGLRSKPLKLATSLKSIISSFLPLLATKLVYFLIMEAIAIGFGFCIAFLFFGFDASSKFFMAVLIVATILLCALFLYLAVQWCLAYAAVVVESKYGYAALKCSWSLVKRARLVAFLLVVMLTIVQMGLMGWFSALARSRGCSAGVVAQMVLYAALSTIVGLFWLGATTVLLVQCKGESEELEFQSDERKLAQLYVQLPHDEV